MLNTDILAEAVGWIGFFCIVLAYFLNVNGYLNTQNKNYHYINIVGAFGLGYTALVKNSLPNFYLEVVWFAIAVYGLYKIFGKKNK